MSNDGIIRTTATCRVDEELYAQPCIHCTTPTFLLLQVAVAHIELGTFPVCIRCAQQVEADQP